MTKRFVLLASALLAFAASPAWADTVKFWASMSGATEVPATKSEGAGTVNATLDTATKVLSWDVAYWGLTGPATAAHFHGPADATKAAGVVIPIAKAGDPVPYKGTATLTAEQMADLMAGKWYVNVHTAANPPGEIRGQVMKAK